MFEYKGKKYTLEQLKAAAIKQGYDNFEEFMTKYKNAGMKEAAASGNTYDSIGPTQSNTASDGFDDDMSILQGIKNELTNLGTSTIANAYQFKGSMGRLINDYASPDAAAWFLGSDIDEKGKIVMIDPNTGLKVGFDQEAYDRDGHDAFENRRYYELNRLRSEGGNIKSVYNNTGESLEEVYADAMQETMQKSWEQESKMLRTTDKDVTGFTNAIKNGELDDMLVMGVGFLMNTTKDAGLAYVTRGASMAAQIYGAGYSVYNDEKSKLIYGEDDPDRFKKLILNEEDEVAIPAGLAGLGYLMERAGFKGMTKEIMKRSFGGKKAISLILAGNKEGLTEYGQGLTERMNKNLGQGMTVEEGVVDVSKYMQTEEAWDQYFAGLVGGTGMTSGGRIANAAFRSNETSNAFINKNINDTAALLEGKARATTKKKLKQYDDAIQIKQTELKEYLESNNKLSEYLNETQITDLTSLVNNRRDTSAEIRNLQKGFRRGVVSKADYASQIEALKQKVKNIDSNINTIKTNANMVLLKKDLDAGSAFVGNVDGLTQDVYDTPAEFFAALEQEYKALGMKMPNFDGVNIHGLKVGNKFLINAKVAAEVNAVATSTHEVLHGIVKSTVQADDGTGHLSAKGEVIVNSFINQLSRKEKGLIEELLKNGKYKENKDGTEKDFKEYGEEYLTMYAQLAKEGKFTKNNIQKAGIWFGRLFNKETEFKKISFKDGKSTREFLDAYAGGNKAALEQSVALAQEGVAMKETVEFSKESTNAINELGKVDKDGNNLEEKGTGNFYYQAEADSIVRTIEEKGYLDGLIRSKYKAEKVPPNFVKQVMSELSAHIKAYKPERKNESGLFGWINSQISNKANAVYNREYKGDEAIKGAKDVGETTKEGDVKIQVAAETDAAVTAFETEDLSLAARAKKKADKAKGKEKVESKFRRQIGIETGSDLYNKVLNTARKSLLRAYEAGTSVRNIQRKLRDEANVYLFKDIKNFLGTKDYIKRLKEFRVPIMNSIFTADLVQMERNTPESERVFTRFVKKLTSKEDVQAAIDQNLLPASALNIIDKGTAVSLYEKRNPTEAQFMSYFDIPTINPKTGARSGTRGTRKDQLAKNMAGALSYDATMEVAQEPEIAQKRADLAELKGESLAKDNLEVLAAAIGRDPKIKFSKSNADIGVDILEGKNKDDGYGGKNWQKYIDNPDISNRTKYEVTDEYLKRNSDQNDAIASKELAKLDYFKNGKKRKTKIRTYKKYEIIAKQRAEKIIKDLGLNKEGYVVENLSEKDNNPDIRITRNGKTVLAIEIKGNTARGVSVSFNYKKDGKGLTKGKSATAKQETENYTKKEEALVKDSNKVFDKMIAFVGKDQTTYSPQGNLQISVQGVKSLKEKGLHLEIYKNKYFITTGDVANSYKQKKGKDNSSRTSHVIEMGNAGMYSMDNSAELNIEGLKNFSDQKALIPLTARINFGSVNKAGTHRTVSIRMEPQLNSVFFDKQNISLINKQGNKNIKFRFSKSQQTSVAQDIIKAANKARTTIHFSKTNGASIFDFDETVGISENFIIAKKGNVTQKIASNEWPLVGETLKEQGYEFDFTDFNKVTKGKPGPLLQKMKNQIEKYGPKNVFILTARAPESQTAIHEWLESEGVNIPIENITGLGNSTGQAKAAWVLDKYANNNYNDIYFVDDALQNVKAVRKMLDQLDVKGKSVQAKIKFSKSMDQNFNDILEAVTGIESEKRFSQIKGRKRGDDKGKFRLFIPPSHEDFVGLLYNFMGKGKEGDAHRNFFEQALVRPLNRGYREIDTAKQAIANDYKKLNEQFPDVSDKLIKTTPDGDFTFQDAIRVYLWSKHGHKIPGLTETDQASLVSLVQSDTQLQAYAETLNVISKQETYVAPGQAWETANIRIDLVDATGRVGRADYFNEFNENAETLFNEENLNKIEAAYGRDFREALEDMLHRIKTGVNRPKGASGKPNMFMNWLNASVSGVMFFNTRSALLQQMSNVNFLNFADNNIYAAGKAFANQPQYWKDFAMIFNSDMLKQRRGGLGTDINGAELAEAIKKARPDNMFDQVSIIVGKALKLGFLPTQIGDNIAIATGGAAFYRNRVNKYIKDGMSQKEAETAAFTDFQNITQSTQQSARPDMTSQQQASWIGKLVLNFLNTPSQYNRIIKKAGSDLLNKRITPPNKTLIQSNMSNMSRMLYYGAAQNLIFYSLQTALFAVMFDDEDDEKTEAFLKKKERVINGTLDTLLRGSGIYGVGVSTLKNMIIKFLEQREKSYNKDESAVIMELANFSPVVGIKLRKIVNAEKTLNYNKKVIDEMDTFDIDNPQWSAVTNYVEAITTAPANRIYQKTINVRNASDNQYTAFQRALFLSGYTTWSLDLGDTEKMEQIKDKVKEKNKKKKKKKSIGKPMGKSL